jgi:hypothetical protein
VVTLHIQLLPMSGMRFSLALAVVLLNTDALKGGP